MARFRGNTQVGGRDCWTVFDTEERHSFVVGEIGDLGLASELPRPLRIPGFGTEYRVDKTCRLSCVIDGRPVDMSPWVDRKSVV